MTFTHQQCIEQTMSGSGDPEAPDPHRNFRKFGLTPL